MVITKERWQEAQAAEKGFHKYSLEEGLKIYGFSYENNFRYCEIPKDLEGKTIVEVGCAGFPALYFRENYKWGVIVEPIYTSTLNTICKQRNLEWIMAPVEEIDLPESDEIWLFNVMQHIIDPELFIEKCKAATKTIRYFEPINYPTCLYHPHSFTMGDFKRWFVEPKLYNDYVPHFHDSECAYGIWKASI